MPETPLRISLKAAKAKNEMVNIWHYREQNTRSSDASNSLIKSTWEISNMIFTREENSLWNRKMGKTQQN